MSNPSFSFHPQTTINMNRLLSISILFLGLCSFSGPTSLVDKAFTMKLCKSGHGGDVASGDLLNNGRSIGSVITISHSFKRVKARHFAYKDLGSSAYDGYNEFRKGKEIVLITSTGYANGFGRTSITVGITVEDGRTVNQTVDPKMDGLVLIDATGGVRISNIKDGDLSIGTNGKYETVNIQNPLDKAKFLSWCASERASVFQTHLLIYKNQLKFKGVNSDRTRRRLLVLAKQASTGNIFHMIVYAKSQSFTLYEMASNTLTMLNEAGYEVIGGINLECGSTDALSTSAELSNCDGSLIQGNSNRQRENLSSMLAYYID